MKCAVCDMIAGKAPASVVHQWPSALAIACPRPRVAGHLLVVPKIHVPDATEDPFLASMVAGYAIQFARVWTPRFELTVRCSESTKDDRAHLTWHVIPQVKDEEESAR